MRHRRQLLVLLAVLAALVLPAAAARADGGRPLVFSALGPGSGHGAIGMGGRVFLPLSADVFIPVPLFELDYVRGLGEVVDYELRVDTLLFATYAETGVRARFVGTESFSLALRADINTVLLLVGGSSGGAFATIGVTPGLVVSTGDSTQLTFGLDVPMFFGGVGISGLGSGGGSGFAYIWRPNLGVEFPVGERTSLFVHAQVYLNTEGSTNALPAVAVGAAW